MDERAHTHQARFDSHVQRGAGQPVVAEMCSGGTQRQHLGVRGRIAGANRVIERPGIDDAVHDEDGPDRDLAGVEGQSRLLQRCAHELLEHPLDSSRSASVPRCVVIRPDTIDRVAIELLSLDAGGVLVYPNFDRISDTFARHGIRVSPDALREADPYGRRAVDTAERVAATSDADRGSIHFRVMFERAGVPPDAPVQRVLDELWAYHSEHNLWEYVPPDIAPALEQLAASGVTLAIGSNANGVIHRVFERRQLSRYFSVVCDSHIEGVEKPDPRFFDVLVARAGGRAETTLHLGDLYYVDVVGARRAGLQAMLMDPHGLYEGFDVPRVRTLSEVATHITMRVP